MRADGDTIQGAVVLRIGVILTLLNSAFNALIDVCHFIYLLKLGSRIVWQTASILYKFYLLKFSSFKTLAQRGQRVG